MTSTSVSSDPTKDTRHHRARAFPEFRSALDYLANEGKSPRTRDDYERSWAVLLNEFPDLDWRELEPWHFARVLANYPAGSYRTRFAHFASLCRILLLLDVLDRNPMDKVAKRQRPGARIVETFSESQIEVLCRGVLDGTLFRVLFDAGLRKGEARRLVRANCRIERDPEGRPIGGEIAVHKSKRDKSRLVPMTARLAVALDELFTLEGLNPGDHLWYTKPSGGTVIYRDKPVSEARFWTWYARCLADAGVPHLKPHATRHTFATMCLRKGVKLEVVGDWMGHSSYNTTKDTYGHLTIEDTRADINLLEV